MNKDEYTISEKMISVSDIHQLYTQLWGNKSSKKVYVFLHGGPGSGVNDGNKVLFNPKKDLVLFFDQRGAGKSMPRGSLVDNNTDELIKDIDKITNEYKLDKFILVGGSWGSCLALAYAIKKPARVAGMIVRGIFTGRQSEIDFLDNGEFKSFYPDVWDQYLNTVPSKFRGNPEQYHKDKIFNGDDEARKSALAYGNLEGSVMSLDDRSKPFQSIDDPNFDPKGTIIEKHYLVNKCFLKGSYILDNAHKLTMPVQIVQGRYDMVCPPITAYELNQKLPNSNLYFTVAGHSGHDRANLDVVKSLIAAS